MWYLFGIVALCFLLRFLVKRKLLMSFLINAVAGLLCCILCVCLSPLIHIRFSLNLFTGTVSALLGPAVAGMITGFCGYYMHRVGACYGGTEFMAKLIHKR